MTAPLKLTTSMPQNVMIDAINQNFRQIEGESRRKVVTDEDGKDRIIIGRKEDGGYAVKVSATGYDVNIASDDQLVMNSDWQMWKIIASGQKYMNPTSTRRSGSLSLTSTYIGYVNDVFIPIQNLPNPTASNFANRLQVFVRDFSTKRDLNFSGTFFNNGTNRATVQYSYIIYGKYLVLRTTVRWEAGTVSITPQSHALMNVNPYWEIANPTRATPGGMGGGGSPTGQYVYYDSVTYNPYTITLYGTDASFSPASIAADSFSSVYSYTYQFQDAATGYRFPYDSIVPYFPSVTVN